MIAAAWSMRCLPISADATRIGHECDKLVGHEPAIAAKFAELLHVMVASYRKRPKAQPRPESRTQA